MDFIENTLDKKEELCNLLMNYLYEIHQKDDGEYRYLNDGDICITVINTDDDNKKIYLDLQEEFTLSFGAFHSHYESFQYGYDDLVTDLKGILENRIGAASIYHHYEGKLNWLGSLMISIEEAETKTVKQVFHHVFHTKDFWNDLEQYGGEVWYEFWDFRYDKRIMIDKKIRG